MSVSPEKDPQAYLAESVTIEPMCLAEEFVRLPSDLSYWNAQYAEASRDFLFAKMEYEEVQAKLYLEHRETLLANSGKATESQIDAHVTCDERMHTARAAFIEAEAKKARLNGALDAVRAKGSALISLGAHIRAEMQGDPSLRTQAQGMRDLERSRR